MVWSKTFSLLLLNNKESNINDSHKVLTLNKFLWIRMEITSNIWCTSTEERIFGKPSTQPSLTWYMYLKQLCFRGQTGLWKKPKGGGTTETTHWVHSILKVIQQSIFERYLRIENIYQISIETLAEYASLAHLVHSCKAKD